MAAAYDKLGGVNSSGGGRRQAALAGSAYFKVSFFGRQLWEEEHAREYVYREPKTTSLAELAVSLSFPIAFPIAFLNAFVFLSFLSFSRVCLLPLPLSSLL